MDDRGTTRCKDVLWKVDLVVTVAMVVVVAAIAASVNHDYTSLQESFVARFVRKPFPCGTEEITFADVSTLDELECFLSPADSPLLQLLFEGTGVCTVDGLAGACTADDGAVYEPVPSAFCDALWPLPYLSVCTYYKDGLSEVTGPALGRRMTSAAAPDYLRNSFTQVVGDLVFFTGRTLACADTADEVAVYVDAVATRARDGLESTPQSVQQCQLPRQYQTVDVALVSEPSYRSLGFVRATGPPTEVASRVFPATYRGAHEKASPPLLANVTAELAQMSTAGFVDQYTRTVGFRVLLFNANLKAFGLATVVVEQSGLDGTMVPFYEWSEASTEVLMYLVVMFCVLASLASMGLLLNGCFFRAYAIQLFLTVDAVGGQPAFGGRLPGGGGGGEHSNGVPVPEARAETKAGRGGAGGEGNTGATRRGSGGGGGAGGGGARGDAAKPSRRRHPGAPEQVEVGDDLDSDDIVRQASCSPHCWRILRHLALSPHLAALDAAVLLCSVAGVVVVVHNIYQDRTDIDNARFVAAEAAAAATLGYFAMLLVLFRLLKTASFYSRHTRVLGVVMVKLIGVVIATGVVLVPVAMGLMVLLNQMALPHTRAFGAQQSFMWLPQLISRQNVPQGSLLGSDFADAVVLLFQLGLFATTVLTLVAWAGAFFVDAAAVEKRRAAAKRLAKGKTKRLEAHAFGRTTGADGSGGRGSQTNW